MQTLGQLFLWVRPFWSRIGIGVAAMAGVSLLVLVPPLLLRTVVDEVLTPPYRPELILPIAGILVGVHFLNAGLVATQLWMMHVVSYGFARMARRELFGHVQRLSLSFYDNRQSGELTTLLTTELEEVRLFVEHGLDSLFSDALKIVGIALVLFWVQPQLALIALLPVPVMAVLMYRFSRQVRPRYRTVRARFSEVAAGLQDRFAGIRVIKAFSQEEREDERFGQQVDAHHGSQLQALSLWGRYNPVLAFTNSIGAVLVLGFGAHMVLRGDLTIGSLFAFTAYVAMFYHPVRNLVNVNDDLQQALAATDRLLELRATKPEVQDAPDAPDLPRLRGHVVFEDVSFRYRGVGEEVLTDIDLEVRPGERVALVGRSGAGKSSLVNLVARFYDPASGTVRIDGYDLRQVSQSSLRAQIAFVLQDTFLFNGSARENIAYARPEASEEEVEAAAKAAHAHEFIRELPDGYETHIGERGVKLSGGQKQRLAIARAILADPAILILDEATSSVDSESEQLIQQALERVSRDRTTIIIAHRLSTVRDADRIFVLEDGKIAEEGRHDDLLERGGIYRQLCEMQYSLEALAAPPAAPRTRSNPSGPSGASTTSTTSTESTTSTPARTPREPVSAD